MAPIVGVGVADEDLARAKRAEGGVTELNFQGEWGQCQ